MLCETSLSASLALSNRQVTRSCARQMTLYCREAAVQQRILLYLYACIGEAALGELGRPFHEKDDFVLSNHFVNGTPQLWRHAHLKSVILCSTGASTGCMCVCVFVREEGGGGEGGREGRFESKDEMDQRPRKGPECWEPRDTDITKSPIASAAGSD